MRGAEAKTFGRYRLLHKLGQGGMAEVFLAELSQGGGSKLLAIKRLLPAFNARQDVVERLASEARLTVWLTHPNIVQVLDFGRVEGVHYIAMEYVDGCDLRALIGRGQASVQLPFEVALEIAYRILDALRYAHECSDASGRRLEIIHRDVSPHNVLIGRDGHPRLTDFGLARAKFLCRQQQTQPGTLLGKVGYMAPEQARGGDYDARVDLFATGATLYEMLTGARPFTDRAAQLAAGMAILPPPPSSLRPSVPATLDELVLRALAPDPEHRFSSAAEMGAVVLEHLVALGGSPRPHQLQQLVEEAVPSERSPGQTRLVPDELAVASDSVIGAEVTSVRARSDEGLPATSLWAKRSRPAARWLRLAALALGGLSLFLGGVLTGRSCAPREPAPLTAATAPSPWPPPAALALDLAPPAASASPDRGVPATVALRTPDQGVPAAALVPDDDVEVRPLRVRPRSEPEAKRGSSAPLTDSEWSAAVRKLRAAQAAYSAGDHQRAIALSREVVKRIPESASAWQIIAVSSCRLGRAQDAAAAAAHLERERLNLLKQVCRRYGVELM